MLARLRHPGIAQVYDAGTHREGIAEQHDALDCLRPLARLRAAERNSREDPAIAVVVFATQTTHAADYGGEFLLGGAWNVGSTLKVRQHQEPEPAV